MSEEIYKAARISRDIEKSKDKGDYRQSHLAGINPRSETKVKRGSMLRRGVRDIGGTLAGGAVGGGVGTLVGRGNPQMAGIGASLGSAGGRSIGRTYNIKSGDTKAKHRSSGKKAKGNITLPGALGSYWRY
jgi:hypothetical protein